MKNYNSLDKVLVLENGFEFDIPEELRSHLSHNNIEFDWYDTRCCFWKENRETTFEFFSNLPTGKQLYCHTTFDGFQQLELFIELLHKLKDKNFTLKIMHGSLADGFIVFYNERESSITPKELEKELDDTETHEDLVNVRNKILDFKKEMNKKFLEVLEFHDIYWISWDKNVLFNNLDDIKNNCYTLQPL